MPYTHHRLGSLKELISVFLEVSIAQRAQTMKLEHLHFELKVRDLSVIFLRWSFEN